MRTSDFDFHLPPELIAQTPAEPRDSSRLMVLRRGARSIEHRVFSDLPNLLAKGDLLVVNDTRVLAARLFGVRPETKGVVEALLVRPFTDRRWEVLFRPARQAVVGRAFVFNATAGELGGTVVRREPGTIELEFDRVFDPSTVGSIPLPPYIKGYKGDPERYQTVYSKQPTSSAAPTAGLHFTPGLLRDLADTYTRLDAYELAADVQRLRAKNLPSGSPSWFDARYGLALAYYRSGKPSEALSLIDATTILHPDLGGGELRNRFIRLRQRIAPNP